MDTRVVDRFDARSTRS